MRIDFQNAILLVLCLVLLLSVFTLSASASPSDFFEITSSMGRVDLGSTKASTNSPYPVYLARVGSPAGTLYAFFTDSIIITNGYTVPLYRGGGASTSYFANLRNATLSGSVYYCPFNSTAPDGASNVPYYDTLADALSAFSSEPVTPISVEYSLPPGNIAFIEVPSGAEYTLKTRMPESVLGTNHYPGNNQVLTLVNSLPTGGTAPSTPLIPWQQEGALSVLGLSRNAIYSATNSTAGYLCIVNPLYYSGTANGPYEFLSNGSIDISIDKQSGIWVYPLDSTLGFTSGLGVSVDTEIINEPFVGTVDPDTGVITWADSSGGATAPTTGGGNLVSTSETIFDFLRNIADEISTFLKGPIQAIQTVVSAIRQFLNSFTQLYMWLPAPVYNLITSALMIALTIGVIKIFV